MQNQGVSLLIPMTTNHHTKIKPETTQVKSGWSHARWHRQMDKQYHYYWCPNAE